MKTKTVLTAALLMAATFSLQAQNWFQVASGTQKKLNTIYFSSANVGYIGGNDSLLLKTTNGGLTWSPLSFTGVTFLAGGEHILNLQFLTDDIGYMSIGPYSGSYKTIDGGLSWTALPILGNQCFNKGLYFFDQNNGFIGGSGCFQGEIISRLSSGVWSASTINSPTLLPDNYITDMDFYNANYGLAVSKSGYVFRTNDGGINWDSIPASAALNPLTSVLIVNDTLAYAGYQSLSVGFGLYISTNGGLTWNDDGNSATFFYPDFICLHQSGNGQIYSGGFSQSSSTGLIFQSPGDIISWNYSTVDQQINDISSYNDSTVFGVGDSGYIVVNRLLQGLSTNDVQSGSIEINLFPNPARTTISLNVPANFETKNATIKLYSAVGSLIHSAAFSSSIDVSTLSCGVYFLEVVADDDVIAGKKFLVE
jgi:photosystem II stability/assembly factor-like uncharacterized protein